VKVWKIDENNQSLENITKILKRFFMVQNLKIAESGIFSFSTDTHWEKTSVWRKV